MNSIVLKIAAVLASPLMLSACATLDAGPGENEPEVMTATERLANDLVEAEIAFQRDDVASLSRRLRSIELAGATPSDSNGEQALAAWRAKALRDGQTMRGRVLGPGYKSGKIAPGSTIDVEQILLGGEVVVIAAGTAPRAGLHLVVKRSDGKAVCEQSPAHARECRFVPTYTQRYHIALSNTGEREARYHLVFN